MPSGGGSSRTVTTNELSPEQQRLIGMVMPSAENYLNTPLQLPTESGIAGPTATQQAARTDIVNTAQNTVAPLTQQSINTAQNLTATGAAGGTAGATNLVNAGGAGSQSLGQIFAGYEAGQGGWDFLRSGALLRPETNPVLAAQTTAALRPVTEQLTQQVLPGIQSDFVGGNMFGSSRQGIAEGRAVDGYLRQAGDIATELQMNNFNQGLGAMLSSLNSGESAATSATGQALGAGAQGSAQFFDAAMRSLAQSPQLAQLAFLPGMTMEGIGQMEQMQNQAQLTEQQERYMTQQMLPFMQAQDVANLAMGLGGGTSTSTGSQQAPFDPMGTALGFAMMLPMLGISDPRTKHNIRRIGQVNDVNVYSFNYYGHDDEVIGVMADEVPHAIAGEIYGYSVVDYGRIAA